MKVLFGFIVFAAIACCVVSCAYREPYQRVPQRDATISPQEERVEELERTERTETGPWQEKVK
jgi:hypothetical protein